MLPHKKQYIIIILTLIIFNFIVYFNSIGNEFVWDDIIVQENHQIRSISGLKELLIMEDTVPYFSGTGYFRPVVSITYFIDYQIHGGKPYGYRLTNIIFHILCSIVLFFLIMLLTDNRSLSFIAALIFSAQAVHVEAVAFIAGRNNVVCTLFILLSLYYYIKNARQAKKTHLAYSMLFLFLGAASKEFAFVVPVIFILYDLSFDDDFSVKKHINGYIAAFSTVFLFFLYKSSAMLLGGALVFDTPNMYKRILTTFTIMVKYLVLQVVPYNITLYLDMPVKESFFDPAVAGSFLLLLALFVIVFRHRKKHKLLFFAFFAYFILLLPVSNIVKIAGTMMADRWLYPASAFFSLFLARLILVASREDEAKASLFTIVFVIFLSLFALQRNHEFKNELLFFSKVVESFPKSSIGRNNLGRAFKRRGYLKEAEEQYILALKYNTTTNSYLIYNNLGAVYSTVGDWGKALQSFKKSYELYPRFPITTFNIGLCNKVLGNIDESNKYFYLTIKLDNGFHPARFALADNYIGQKRFKEARDIIQAVLKLSSNEDHKKTSSHYLTVISDNEAKNPSQ